jgi:hypothetical protein
MCRRRSRPAQFMKAAAEGRAAQVERYIIEGVNPDFQTAEVCEQPPAHAAFAQLKFRARRARSCVCVCSCRLSSQRRPVDALHCISPVWAGM